MPNSNKTPLLVRVVLFACIAGAIAVVACVKGGGASGPTSPALPPGTVSFTIQAH